MINDMILYGKRLFQRMDKMCLFLLKPYKTMSYSQCDCHKGCVKRDWGSFFFFSNHDLSSFESLYPNLLSSSINSYSNYYLKDFPDFVYLFGNIYENMRRILFFSTHPDDVLLCSIFYMMLCLSFNFFCVLIRCKIIWSGACEGDYHLQLTHNILKIQFLSF